MEEHVPHAVQVIEDAGQYPLLEILHQVIQDLDTHFEDHLAQIEELLIGDASLLEASRILRPSKGEEWSQFLSKIFCK
jgi:hypothetical protein